MLDKTNKREIMWEKNAKPQKIDAPACLAHWMYI